MKSVEIFTSIDQQFKNAAYKCINELRTICISGRSSKEIMDEFSKEAQRIAAAAEQSFAHCHRAEKRPHMIEINQKFLRTIYSVENQIKLGLGKDVFS